MNDVDRALSQIEDMHAHLAASTRFQGIAPEVNALSAILVLVVATAQTLWPQILAPDALGYIVVWAAVSLASTCLVGAEAVSRARRLHGPLAPSMLRLAMLKALPFTATGLVITGVICILSIENAWLLPGMWQLLVALIGFSAASSLPRTIIWAASWYFLCGTVVLAIGAGTEELSPWMMGIPLAVGQVIVAIIFYSAGKSIMGRRY